MRLTMKKNALMSLMLGATLAVAGGDSPHYFIRGDSIEFGRTATDDDVAVLQKHPNLRAVIFGTGPYSGPDPRRIPIKITDKGFAHLARCKKLRTLSLSCLQPLQVTDEGLKSLSELKELRVIQLCATPFSAKGLAHIAGLPNVEELWFDFNSQYDDTAMDAIVHHEKLRVLRFYGAPITDKGVAKLKALSNLEDLQLGKSRVGDEGLSVIAGLAKLEKLDLQYTRVTNAGMKHLKSLRQLQWLCLKGTAVTRTGLAQLSDLPQLDSLYLDESQVRRVPPELKSKLKGNARPTPAGAGSKGAAEE